MQYREVRNLDATRFTTIAGLGPGWHPLARDATSGALDYLRSPLLRGRGCLTLIAGPLAALVTTILRSPRFGWVESTADNALNLLEQRLTGCRRVHVFGAPYTHGPGVHDIHYNQGDPPGQFQHLDGIWQDGGTIIESTTGEFTAFLTKFKTQVLDTGDNGLPA
ncbi:DUF2278 family protein [Amycolatopsis sp. NPDC049252]|uniref:DUF2278 family protein n=1 Tax=Amycolatopsis sp. NPDC049252 TaxID=3363933 RepID=UPI0037156A59